MNGFRSIGKAHLPLLFHPWISAALMLPAAAVAGTSGWTEYTSVAELTPSSDQSYTVRLTITENPSGCKNKNTFYQDYTASGAEQMFNTLLKALVNSKRVRVFVTGRCELNGYGEISSVSILP
jgi:hypothetical protein